MRIGGWQKVSVTDYPGKIATILFTSGCCFRCGFCHNPELVVSTADSRIDEEMIFDYLKKRCEVLEGAVITGGEPTIHHDIIDFIEKIKDIGYAVKLDTCGYLPDRVKNVIERRCVDYIAMDIKAPLNKYSYVTGVPIEAEKILQSISHIISSGIPHEFRSTLVEGIHTEQDILEMAKMIEGASAYYLQRFKAAPKLLNQSFQEKRPPSDLMLENARNQCAKYVKICEVR